MKSNTRNALLFLALCTATYASYANGERNERQATPQVSANQAQMQAAFANQKQTQQANANNSTKVNTHVANKNIQEAVNAPTAFATGGVVSGVLSSSGVTGVTGTGGAGGQASTAANTGGNVLSSVYEQVKQAPMAWSPNMALSMSPENCSNSVSFGASAGFGAISGGAPMDSDACNRRMDTRMWISLGQMRIACERMKQDDDNAQAMQASGLTCTNVVQFTEEAKKVGSTARPVLPPDDYWAKAAAVRDAQLRAIENSQRGFK